MWFRHRVKILFSPLTFLSFSSLYFLSCILDLSSLCFILFYTYPSSLSPLPHFLSYLSHLSLFLLLILSELSHFHFLSPCHLSLFSSSSLSRSSSFLSLLSLSSLLLFLFFLSPLLSSLNRGVALVFLVEEKSQVCSASSNSSRRWLIAQKSPIGHSQLRRAERKA